MKVTKELNTNKGITLIALVITIIVMLILVAVTISMAVNGGLFNYAGKAVGDTKNALDTEQELGNGGITVGGTYYNSIDEYLNKDTGTTLVSLYKSGELKVGDYVDYNPAGVNSVNPDNPENAEGVAVGALTGYTKEAQSVAYESLKWRVLGYDETKNELLLISATPTNSGINFYGHVGYNNYENVLKTTCSKLYSNSSIGATARSITMNDIDSYLGGSAFKKEEYSSLGILYGYRNQSVSSRFKIDTLGNLVRLGDEEDSVILDLTNDAYYYRTIVVIKDEIKLDLLEGSVIDNPFYYWVASRSVGVDSAGAAWCVGVVHNGGVYANRGCCSADGFEGDVPVADGYDSLPLCIRPVVTLTSKVTTEQVPVLETVPTITWRDPLDIYDDIVA